MFVYILLLCLYALARKISLVVKVDRMQTYNNGHFTLSLDQGGFTIRMKLVLGAMMIKVVYHATLPTITFAPRRILISGATPKGLVERVKVRGGTGKKTKGRRFRRLVLMGRKPRPAADGDQLSRLFDGTGTTDNKYIGAKDVKLGVSSGYPGEYCGTPTAAVQCKPANDDSRSIWLELADEAAAATAPTTVAVKNESLSAGAQADTYGLSDVADTNERLHHPTKGGISENVHDSTLTPTTSHVTQELSIAQEHKAAAASSSTTTPKPTPRPRQIQSPPMSRREALDKLKILVMAKEFKSINERAERFHSKDKWSSNRGVSGGFRLVANDFVLHRQASENLDVQKQKDSTEALSPIQCPVEGSKRGGKSTTSTEDSENSPFSSFFESSASSDSSVASDSDSAHSDCSSASDSTPRRKRGVVKSRFVLANRKEMSFATQGNQTQQVREKGRKLEQEIAIGQRIIHGSHAAKWDDTEPEGSIVCFSTPDVASNTQQQNLGEHVGKGFPSNPHSGKFEGKRIIGGRHRTRWSDAKTGNVLEKFLRNAVSEPNTN